MLVLSSTVNAHKPTAVAIGNFDGLHRGHRQVIQPVLDLSPDSCLLKPTVLSFSPHPQEFFGGMPRPLLTPLPEKAACLRLWGVSQFVLLPFDAALAALSPQRFLDQILLEQLAAKRISVGFNFRFGHRRTGSVEDLKSWAQRVGVEVMVVPELTYEGQRVSSSRVRACLLAGEVAAARHLLGRAYSLTGRVVRGQQLGRTLGFPTANLKLPERKFLPRDGVYCARVAWSDIHTSGPDLPPEPWSEAIGLPASSGGQSVWAVMNIGTRPSVGGTSRTVEVHLLDWSGDLYHCLLTVELERFLRPEQKFDSLDALKRQIEKDREAALSYFREPVHS